MTAVATRPQRTVSREVITTAKAEALFASTLSACEPHDRVEVQAAIAASVTYHGGVRGCAGQMAKAYGESPEWAAARMRWARGLVA